MKKNLDYTCFDHYKAADLAVDDSFIEWVNSDGASSKFWNDWVQTNPHKAKEVDSARFIVLALGQKERHTTTSQVNETWTQITDSIHNQELAEQKTPRFRYLYYLTAAVFFLGLISSTVYLLINTDIEGNVELVEKHTNYGQRLTTVLPDGSKVTLNAGSRISYYENYGKSQRLVNLSGEAYFDIRHNPQVPFITKVGSLETKVLGTTFNIKAYNTDQVEIALESGSVEVVDLSKEEQVFLEPGQILRIDSVEFQEIQKYNHREIFGWKNNYLCFTRSSFTDAIENLERWYGVDFVVKDDVKLDDSWKFHGKFHDKSLAYVLHTLSYPNLFKYEIKDKQVTIY